MSAVVRQPDPPIVSGPFRAMRRSDGVLAIVDERRELGAWELRTARNEDEARMVVGELAALASTNDGGRRG